jgi:hypothetical protein
VTELTQPLAAVPAKTHDAAVTTAGVYAVTFSELVAAHFAWWRSRQQGVADESVRRAYDDALARFEARHGTIVGSYWCSEVESAVALTERRRLRGWLDPVFVFHRETDWATHAQPAVATELYRCEELAVRARAVLTGVRQRICLQLVLASASHLLSLVDERVDGRPKRTDGALERERAAITKAERYYCEAANGQAQMVYFGGMASVALVLSVVAAVWLSLGWASPVAALIAGAAGAVVSVIQRINNGKFTLDYDVGGPYAFFLGGLRPLIGGAFAMAISFAFGGGLLHLPVAAGEPTDHRRLALLVLGFVAGFSERWAQDTLTAIAPMVHSEGQRPPAPPETPAETGPQA